MVDFNTTSSSASLLTEHQSQASSLGLDISNDNKTQHQSVINPSISSMRDVHRSNPKINLLTCIAALSTGYQVINAIQYKSNSPHSYGRALNSACGIALALLGLVGAIAISSKEQTNNIENLKEKESTNTNDNENTADFVEAAPVKGILDTLKPSNSTRITYITPIALHGISLAAWAMCFYVTINSHNKTAK